MQEGFAMKALIHFVVIAIAAFFGVGSVYPISRVTSR